MSLHPQPGKTHCDIIECRNSAVVTCDGCAMPLCFDHMFCLPGGQHACLDCWCGIQVVWPRRTRTTYEWPSQEASHGH